MVKYMEFTDDLVTGNDLIDGQHKELIGKINDLLRTCETGDGKVKALNTLDYLEEYTNFHFSQEEALQEEIGYPGLKEHQTKHQEFVQSIKELYEMLEVDTPVIAYYREHIELTAENCRISNAYSYVKVSDGDEPQ